MDPATVVLSLGANLGDPDAQLDEALTALREHPQITLEAVSDRAVTSPVGGPEGQPDYLNQTVIASTTLAPYDLLAVTQGLEEAAHRVRDIRWGPRTLDVDIISYGDIVSEDPVLTLPHPRAHERAFVLVPWSWIDPDATLNGTPIRELISALPEGLIIQRRSVS